LTVQSGERRAERDEERGDGEIGGE
jgi:hypothetical protein